MILLSVGTQLPFDRLVRAVDDWAVGCGRVDVIAQSDYAPRNLKCFQFLPPEEFRDLQAEARVTMEPMRAWAPSSPRWSLASRS